MCPDDLEKSLCDEATFAGAAKRRSTAETSLGGQQTLGGGDRSGQDTVIDEIEVVDFESRYKIEGTLGSGREARQPPVAGDVEGSSLGQCEHLALRFEQATE